MNRQELLSKAIIFAGVLAAATLAALIFNANSTIVHIDGKNLLATHKLSTPAQAEDFLKTKGMALHEKDIVLPPSKKRFLPRNYIGVMRVREETAERALKPVTTVLWKNTAVGNLRKVELQKAIIQESFIMEKNTYHDNKLVNTIPLKERMIKRSTYRLLLLDKTGALEKVYDLSKVKKMKMVATAYYPGDPLAWGDGTVTFLGIRMQRGIVAVDPKVIPLRTRVYVPCYGYGFAGDTGNLIKGHRIDLGVRNAQEEKNWMHKKVDVYILEQAYWW